MLLLPSIEHDKGVRAEGVGAGSTMLEGGRHTDADASTVVGMHTSGSHNQNPSTTLGVPSIVGRTRGANGHVQISEVGTANETKRGAG